MGDRAMRTAAVPDPNHTEIQSMRRSLFLLAAAFSVGCAFAAGYGGMPAKPELGAWGVDLTAMDRSVKPGDDFFSFVNGKLAEDHRHPARAHQHRNLPAAAHPQRKAHEAT